ncbi:hypothetical protein Krac_12233 [Ktedonobacter racemifer DSM 44963]|uniref:Uncharacterized protein n=1 Tax=Ktedonobacter racemifer DSM 44963 TaxID=485913 RepID=D6TFX3_KTERA|nr:hypothetical protein Krac_12233 [Ktedonobacter racemifer DSM 44963]
MPMQENQRTSSVFSSIELLMAIMGLLRIYGYGKTPIMLASMPRIYN